MQKGQVFDIQHFSTHDGPGIRTTVFLKGCPLRCVWCHNPESQLLDAELLFNTKLCIDCQSCENTCPHSRAREILSDNSLRKQFCEDCYLCAEICNSGAIEKTGDSMSVMEVIDEVEKDRIFYDNSGGGITLSGGEPFFQFNFLLELFQTSKSRGLHTCVETSGFVSKESLAKVIPFIDLFLYDIKLTENELHEKWTGVSLDPIIENLKFINAQGKDLILRAIMIPELNMNDKHLKCLADLCNSLDKIKQLELIPYHELGNSKNERLGKKVETYFLPPSKEMIEIAKKYLKTNIHRDLSIC